MRIRLNSGGIQVGTRLSRGTLLHYECRRSHAASFVRDSGNEARVCLASGRLSGSRLRCLDGRRPLTCHILTSLPCPREMTMNQIAQAVKLLDNSAKM
ncbi:hypothetical protein RRG08_051152 [Elysia crispata]|uniref:Uncharacterized protein n=1 Tax=Elysia crispata TaxID=231223 RepID=A0AAE1D1E4_9GAST|nr:hypothetical protein RRG08_051152 [Elysia crispata]